MAVDIDPEVGWVRPHRRLSSEKQLEFDGESQKNRFLRKYLYGKSQKTSDPGRKSRGVRNFLAIWVKNHSHSNLGFFSHTPF